MRSGLVGAAAATVLLAGRPTQSIGLLGHGRAVQWTRALQLRTDLAALRAVAPELADRLDALRQEQELDKPVVEWTVPSMPARDPYLVRHCSSDARICALDLSDLDLVDSVIARASPGRREGQGLNRFRVGRA
ncbi:MULTISPECIES: hypothetical protein [unclassified Streptomyces]|uniref:hypothetical protein n=1 Tax=unclassified Streptomyces TaxID=2593676 RepID=UPI0037F5C3D5